MNQGINSTAEIEDGQDCEVVRTIVAGWIVYNQSGEAMTMTINEDQFSKDVELVKSKFGKAFYRKITTNVDNYQKIGNYLVETPLPKGVDDPLRFRNELIIKSTSDNSCWEWVRRDFNLPESMTYEDMNDWLMIHHEYKLQKDS